MLKIEVKPIAGGIVAVAPKNADLIEITARDASGEPTRAIELTFAEFRELGQSIAGLIAFMTMQRMADEKALRDVPTDGGMQ